jgi:hypothetical protein
MGDTGLSSAKGGLVVKGDSGKFAYCLHGQPQPEGEPFVKVIP